MNGGGSNLCLGGASCDCCKTNQERGGFQKIKETKYGLNIYTYTGDDKKHGKETIENNLITLKDILPAKGNNVENIFIIYINNNEKEKQVADSLQKFDINDVSCPRCRHFMTRAKLLLEKMSVSEKKGINAICDLCKLQRQYPVPCEHCQRAINHFEAENSKDMCLYDSENHKPLLITDKIKESTTLASLKGTKYFSEKYVQPHLIPEMGEDITTVKLLKSVAKSDTTQEPKSNDRPKITPYHYGLHSDTILGIGTTGIIRRSHSEDSLITSFSEIPKQVFKKNFKYFFPRNIKTNKTLVDDTSQELIKGIHNRLRLETEEKVKKEEEIQKNGKKIQKHKSDEDELHKKELQKKNTISDEGDKKQMKRTERENIKTGYTEETLETGKEKKYELRKGSQATILDADRRKKRERDEKIVHEKIDEKDEGKQIREETGDKKELKSRDQKETKFGREYVEEKIQDKEGKEEKVRVETKEKEKVAQALKEKGDKVEIEKTKHKVEQKQKAIKGFEDKRKGETASIYKEDQRDIGKQQKVVEGLNSKGKRETTAKEKEDQRVSKNQEQNLTDQVKETEERERKEHKRKKEKEEKHEVKNKTKAAERINQEGDEKQKEEKHAIKKMEKKSNKEMDEHKSRDDVQEKAKKIEEIKESKKSHDVKAEKDTGFDKKAALTKESLFNKSREQKESKKTSGDGDAVNLLNEVLKKQEKEKMEEMEFKKALSTQLHANKKRAEEANLALQSKSEYKPLINVKAEKIKKLEAYQDEKKKEEKGDKIEKKKKATEVAMKDVNMKESGDDLILKMVKMRSEKPTNLQTPQLLPPPTAAVPVKRIVRKQASVSNLSSDLQLDAESLLRKVKGKELKEAEVIIGNNIILKKDIPHKPEPKIDFISIYQSGEQQDSLDGEVHKESTVTPGSQPETTGPLRYSLSDRTFIDKGWTVLPIEKIVRKVNIYRMTPASADYNWFHSNKDKLPMCYDSGELLAAATDDGRGRWYYKNGNTALDFYESEEPNTVQRIVVYSSGCPDKTGRSLPVTVLGMFDYNGNGVVFDHQGKIRLKYNQNEGIVLDRELGPVSHWLWHSLNEPPELKQVMIDTQMNYKDPGILALSKGFDEKMSRDEDEQIIAIEYDNFIKSKNMSNDKQFKPYQINMKALKINDQFSLRVIDQKKVFLLFRDGHNFIKLKLGMSLNDNEIVETSMTEVGEVYLTMEKLPPVSDSVEHLQKSLLNARRLKRVRVEKELRMMPRSPAASLEEMTSAVSKPIRLPISTKESCYAHSSRSAVVQPTANTLYSNTRLF